MNFGRAIENAIFGRVADASRFPLLVKLLDAHDTLRCKCIRRKKSPRNLAANPRLNFGMLPSRSPAPNFWPDFARMSRAINLRGCARRHCRRSRSHNSGPNRRLHFSARWTFPLRWRGNVLVEIQQNSDTTYRVFDWNRRDDKGKPRQLHVDQALECIDFTDVAPKLTDSKGETLVKHELFEVQKWNLDAPREIIGFGHFAIVCCLTGAVRLVDVDLRPGEFFLVPASLQDRQIQPRSASTTLLRVAIPK